MKDKVVRVKHFVLRHRTEFAYLAGCTIGGYIGATLTKNYMQDSMLPMHMEINMNVTSEELMARIDKVKGFAFGLAKYPDADIVVRCLDYPR